VWCRACDGGGDGDGGTGAAAASAGGSAAVAHAPVRAARLAQTAALRRRAARTREATSGGPSAVDAWPPRACAADGPRRPPPWPPSVAAARWRASWCAAARRRSRRRPTGSGLPATRPAFIVRVAERVGPEKAL